MPPNCLGVLLLGMLVFFGVASMYMVVLFGEDKDIAGSDFVMDYGLVVLAYDVDAEYLGWKISDDSKR
jgi:hypothetical protein